MNTQTAYHVSNHFMNWKEKKNDAVYQLQTLHQANLALTRTLHLEEVLQTLLDYLAKLIPYDTANIMLLGEDRQVITICAMRGHEEWTNPAVVQQITFNLAENGILKNLVHTPCSVLIPDTHDDPDWESTSDTRYVRNWLGVPLIAEGKVIGLYSLNKATPHFFTLEHMQLAELLATQAAVAIRNAHLHEKLQEHARQLEARVSKRTKQLEQSNRELEAFAHTVAHDLKSPLSGIIGYADVLTDMCPPENDALGTYLQYISQNAKQMDSIIHELLMLASMKDDTRVDFYPVNMHAHVERVLMRLNYLINKHKAQIILPDKWPIALGYGAWVEEVWANYISNAIKYGGENPVVELFVHETEAMIQFGVKDKGKGIHPDKLKDLFLPFSRLDTFRAQGHGLGLSIVGRLVEKLHGEYGAHSTWGEGTTFWFSLPKYQ